MFNTKQRRVVVRANVRTMTGPDGTEYSVRCFDQGGKVWDAREYKAADREDADRVSRGFNNDPEFDPLEGFSIV